MNEIPALVRVFAYLSLLTVGGGMAAYPEMEHLTVDVHHWLTEPQLVHFYSVGQMAPGPNMNMVAAIGEKVAGVPGALAVLFAFFIPTGIFAFIVGRAWKKLDNWPWRTSIQEGLAPVALGLMLAGAITLAKGSVAFARTPGGPAEISWIAVVLTVAVLALTLRTKINPAILVLSGGLVGIFAFHP